MKLLRAVRKISDLVKNVFDTTSDVVYIVEPRGWSVYRDGLEITAALTSAGFCKARMRVTPLFLKNKIVHFGSINTTATFNKSVEVLARRNKIVVTWFHAKDDDKHFSLIPLLNRHAARVHTSAQATKEILVREGLREELITVIPLGVNPNQFVSYDEGKRKEMRKKLSLPEDKVIIGSFQKDGQGWGEGDEPKLIKGPDVFCDVAREVSKKHPVHVLLTGPARGYVKQRLSDAGIPFTHSYLPNYYDVAADYFNALDLYIIASRVEGGPKAVLEAWACGVPLVSTRVGMVPDIAEHEKDVLLCESEDVSCLAAAASRLIEDESFRKTIATNGLSRTSQHSWHNVARAYWTQLYGSIGQT